MKVGNKIVTFNLYEGARKNLVKSKRTITSTKPFRLTTMSICDIIFHSIKQQHGETFNRRLERNTL